MKNLILSLSLIGLSTQLPHSSIWRRSVDPYHYQLTRTPPVSSPSDAEGSGKIEDNARRSKYLFPVTVENQIFELELDTGSSDTWIIQSGFECWDTFSRSSSSFSGPEPPTVCNFGATYTTGAGFVPLDQTNLGPCYGQTEKTLRCINGPTGNVSVSLDGLIVNQLIGTPLNSSYPAQGLPEQSGILGMAMAGLTSAYSTKTGDTIQYSPIMQTLFDSFTDSSLEKQFALALSRDESNNGNGGILTIGGIPSLTDPTVNVTASNYTSAAWQLVPSRSKTDYTFYSILVDSFVAGDQTLSPGLQIWVDSGANTVQVPKATADILNSLWSAPFDTDGYLPCDATLTEEFGIVIGSRTYYLTAADLLGTDDGTRCYTLIEGSSGSDGYLVGDPFLKNVLAIFDWENEQLSFYPRQYYAS